MDTPAFNYHKYHPYYSGHRQTDTRIAEFVFMKLKESKAILNVWADSRPHEAVHKYLMTVESSFAWKS